MNFGRNFAKFGDFGHVRNFLTNEIQNPGANTCHTMRVWFHSKEQRSQISTSTQRRKVPSGVEMLVIQISTRYCPKSMCQDKKTEPSGFSQCVKNHFC